MQYINYLYTVINKQSVVIHGALAHVQNFIFDTYMVTFVS